MPLLNTRSPPVPIDPAYPDATLTAPELPDTVVPLLITIPPLCPTLFAAPLPIVTLPLSPPLRDVPLLSTTSPLPPDVTAAPLPIVTLPLSPASVVPLLNTTTPLPPALHEYPLPIRTAPLDT